MHDIRAQFPIADMHIGKRPLIYLDNAATSQKPRCVLDAITRYYEQSNANIHRGAHYLSRKATDAHEEARQVVAGFLGAASPKELIFTSGCTEAINLVAQILGERIHEGDEILITTDAHHSNIVPWQMLAQRRGAKVRPIPLTTELKLDSEAFHGMLSAKTAVLAFPASSNATGMQHPIKAMIAAAKAVNPQCICLVDGAQSTGHIAIDVQVLGCDFYAFSGHKVYAPTGTGALWGRRELLEQLPPWKGGGEMIKEVRFEATTYNELPFKYEAGTPNICGNIVLAEAIRFVQSIGIEKIAAHEHALMQRLCAGLSAMEGVQLLGEASERGALVSVLVEGVHHYDLAMLLDQMGIAVRSGHHCCQPLMHHLGVTGTTRYSVAAYNSLDEMDAVVEATRKALMMLR